MTQIFDEFIDRRPSDWPEICVHASFCEPGLELRLRPANGPDGVRAEIADALPDSRVSEVRCGMQEPQDIGRIGVAAAVDQIQPGADQPFGQMNELCVNRFIGAPPRSPNQRRPMMVFPCSSSTHAPRMSRISRLCPDFRFGPTSLGHVSAPEGGCCWLTIRIR